MVESEFRPMDETPEEFMMSQVFGLDVTQEQIDASRKPETVEAKIKRFKDLMTLIEQEGIDSTNPNVIRSAFNLMSEIEDAVINKVDNERKR